MMEQKYLQAFVDETWSSNKLFLGCFFPAAVWEPLPHFLQSWLRNFIAGTLIYLVTGLLWCFYIYSYNYNLYIHEDAIPSRKSMLLQIYVAMKAMPLYSGLSAVSEYLVENGWTKCFGSANEISWPAYMCYLGIYLVIVEFGVYWMHRLLHDIKPLYKHLHATHHIFNKQNTLSPFAGMAFHPLDGVLLALPHLIGLFLVPVHFTAYRTLLLVEAIWSTNIHDSIHGKVWPIMGAGYHTIHHTTYRHNYGHYTVWVDWIFGTLQDPQDDKAKKIVAMK